MQNAYEYIDVVRPPRLRPGDQVRVVSSAPAVRAALSALGLQVTESETADVDGINQALRDTAVKALIFAGEALHRIADDLDFAAAAAFPTLIVGGDDATILHLAFWERSGLSGIYGTPLDASFAAVAFGTDPVVLRPEASSPTAALTTAGRASGVLLGGDQALVATANGWALPSLHGTILLLTASGLRPADADRQLTMLRRAGRLAGVRAVAVGRYPAEAVGMLREQLAFLGLPVLGGLPAGDGEDRTAIPIGTPAVLDADAGTLTVESAVV